MGNKTSNEPREMTKRDEKDSPDENEESVTLSDSITKKMEELTLSEEDQEEQAQGQQEEQDSERKPISIITSNVGRPFGKSPSVEERKNGIAGLLNEEMPDIVFFQEFPWVDLQTLRNCRNIPVQYEYLGTKGTSIVYNSYRIKIPPQNGILPADVQLRGYLSEFTKDAVFHILKVVISSAQYLCVSWYCPNSDKNEEKLQKLRQMLDSVVRITSPTSLPFIIAGDFNIPLENVQQFITNDMRIYNYYPQERRRNKPKIDFFISSMSATLSDVRSINWEHLAKGANAIFDHDPVKATLPLP